MKNMKEMPAASIAPETPDRATPAPAAPQATPAHESRGQEPRHEDIAAEAYMLYLANGAQDGHDVDDWLEAERRLTKRGATATREESVASKQYEDADLEERTPG